jgi:KipI family sensor histidine kinase inhibitor
MHYEVRTAAVDAVILYFGDRPDEQLVARIGLYTEQLQRALTDLLLDLVPSYTSILLHYDLMQTSEQALRQRIDRVLQGCTDADLSPSAEREVELPVCYDPSVAPDLVTLSDQIGLSVDEIVRLHSAKPYRVFAIGFSPGFGYMGELDARLQVPRLATPRLAVPAGSVAIAERSTAVYPQETPGGWRLIGRCPLPMFSKLRTPPLLIGVGDKVRFRPVSLAEFRALQARHG